MKGDVMDEAENELRELFARVQASGDKQHATIMRLAQTCGKLRNGIEAIRREVAAAQDSAVNVHTRRALLEALALCNEALAIDA